MALVLKDRVQETSTTTGTSTFSLAGAVTEFQTFSSAIGNGNTTYYAAYLSGGNEWEVGIGTVGAGTLSRDTILASSNSGNIVTFSAGTKYVFCTYPAGKSVYLDASGSISEPIVNISGITGAISTVDTITFDTGYTTALTTGQLGWDGNNTLGFGMSGGNIVQQIGLQTYIYGKATATITKGQLIKKTGANGSSGVITFAPTTANMTDGQAIIGVAAENIANNAFGYIISSGNIRGFDTTGSSSGQTWADGDVLYYNPAGGGLMTNVKPSAPNIKVEAGVVTNAGSGGSGSMAVEILHGSVLGGTDSNVQITNPTGGQTIIYDQANGYWKNASLSAGTAISVTNGVSGSITIANTAPDQTVTISAGTGIAVTGSYPTFTIANTNTASGTVTSVNATVPSFLSVSGVPITSSGTIAIAYSGTPLPIANGGTNATATPTNGGVSYGTGTAYAFTSAGSSGQILQSNGASAPTWANRTQYISVTLSNTSVTQVPTSNGYLGVLLSNGSTTTQVPIT